MSKRTAPASDKSVKRSKKREFAAPIPEDEDLLKSQLSAPSSTSLSSRTLPSKEVPSLVTLCIRTLVTNLQILFTERRKDITQYWLKRLPEAIIPRLFATLCGTHPTLISHGLIVAYFLRGDPIVLSGSVPGISSFTIQALAKTGNSLRECHLTDLDKVPDDVFAGLLSQLPWCEVMVLRGSTKVGKRSVEAIANTCKHLRALNLNFTSVNPSSIAYLTSECLELNILKLAGIQSITDSAFSDILHVVPHDGLPLRQLTCLKLKHTSITEQSLKNIGQRCIHLKRLDVSFTHIKHPAVLFDTSVFIPELEKLSLTSTPLTSAFLSKVSVSTSSTPLKFLRTLYIGAMGSSPSSRVRSGLDTLTLTDGTLDLLTDALHECKLLENVSLVGNSKLGMRSSIHSSLARFIRMVGRRCKFLNLAAISRLKSSDLSGLPPIEALSDHAIDDPADYGPSPIQTLNLNSTDVDDVAAAYIATCPNLRMLSIANTKFNNESLFFIIDACQQLTTLDLTSCRHIRIADRRRFFEVWQGHRRTNS